MLKSVNILLPTPYPYPHDCIQLPLLYLVILESLEKFFVFGLKHKDWNKAVSTLARDGVQGNACTWGLHKGK